MFSDLHTKLKRLELPQPKAIFFQLYIDNDFKSLIIRLNTEGERTSQLIHGVNYENQPLDEIGGIYSPYTVMLKKDKAQITDHVTLKDTGEFYSSFKVSWINDGDGTIQITADTIKELGVDLTERWGKQIVGLSEENIQILRDYARNKIGKIIERIRNK